MCVISKGMTQFAEKDKRNRAMLCPHNGLFLGTQKEQRKNRMN